MDKSFPLIVVDSRDSDLSKYDRPVRGQRAGDKDKVLVEVEVRQVMV